MRRARVHAQSGPLPPSTSSIGSIAGIPTFANRGLGGINWHLRFGDGGGAPEHDGSLILSACKRLTEGQNARMSGAGEFKACPFCRQQIRQEAVKCRYCGEWLEDREHSVPSSNSKGNVSEPLASAAQQTVHPSDIHVGAIARDVAILLVLTFIAGLISTATMRPFSVSLFCIVGFCISGCLAKGNRWKHLGFVALFSWLTSIVNVFLGFPFEFWLVSVFGIFAWMGAGGGLSYLFKRRT